MMDTKTRKAAEKVLIHDEGIILGPYKDLNGFWTIGIGRFIGARLENLSISKATALQMLDEDILEHWNDTCEIFGKDFLEQQTPARQIALLSMMFALGSQKFLTFHQTIPAIKEGRWADAAALILKTKLAEDWDPKHRAGEGRDDRIAYMLSTGLFPEDYEIDEG